MAVDSVAQVVEEGPNPHLEETALEDEIVALKVAQPLKHAPYESPVSARYPAQVDHETCQQDLGRDHVFHASVDRKVAKSSNLLVREPVVHCVWTALVFFHGDHLCHFLAHACGRLHAWAKVVLRIVLGPVPDHESTCWAESRHCSVSEPHGQG